GYERRGDVRFRGELESVDAGTEAVDGSSGGAIRRPPNDTGQRHECDHEHGNSKRPEKHGGKVGRPGRGRKTNANESREPEMASGRVVKRRVIAPRRPITRPLNLSGSRLSLPLPSMLLSSYSVEYPVSAND